MDVLKEMDLFVQWCLNFTSMTVVVIGLFFVYIAASVLLDFATKRERMKKERIQNAIDNLVEQYSEKGEKNPLDKRFRLFKYLTMYSKMDEEQMEAVRVNSNKITKEEKAKPYLLLLSSLMKMVLFLLPLMYFAIYHEMERVAWLPYIAIILSIALFISRKQYAFLVVFGLVSFFIYPKLSTEANLFIILKWIHTYFLILFSKRKK